MFFRDQEKIKIKKFLNNCLDKKEKAQCLLLTGNPGTGKTLLTTSVLDELPQNNINIIKINGMRFKNFIELF